VQHYLCFFVKCPRNCCLVMVSLKSLLFKNNNYYYNNGSIQRWLVRDNLSCYHSSDVVWTVWATVPVHAGTCGCAITESYPVQWRCGGVCPQLSAHHVCRIFSPDAPRGHSPRLPLLLNVKLTKILFLTQALVLNWHHNEQASPCLRLCEGSRGKYPQWKHPGGECRGSPDDVIALIRWW